MAQRNVLVTGGMGGLGESICTKMARRGLPGHRHLFAGQHQSHGLAGDHEGARLQLPRLPVRRGRLRLLRRGGEEDRSRHRARSTCWSTTPASRAT